MNKSLVDELIGDHIDSRVCRYAVERLGGIFDRSLIIAECEALSNILQYYQIKFSDEFILGSVENDTQLGGVDIGIITICLSETTNIEFENWKWKMAEALSNPANIARLMLELLEHQTVLAVGHRLK